MIRRWFGPVMLAVLLAGVAFQVAVIEAPRLLMAAAVKRVAQAGGVNHLFHGPLATDMARAVVRPSPDLAYSSCPFDLSGGPVAITARPVPARYWSLSVFDSHTNAAFVRNNVDAGNRAMSVVLARPGQPVPAGVEVVRLGGDKGVALIRILVDDRARFPAIDAARRASSCAPLRR